MGMVMYLRRASATDIACLAADPELAQDFVFPEEYQDVDSDFVDFDKGWQALHFMLTGSAYGADSPLGIIAGDLPQIGKDEISQAPTWLVAPETMADLCRCLGRA